LPTVDVVSRFAFHAFQACAIDPDVGLVGDPGVRRLVGPREHRCLAADSGQLNARSGSCQEPPDLGFDLVIAPLAHPAIDQLSLAVEEVLRWPGVVAQRPPDRELIVDRDRIRQPVVANPTVDVLGALTELELRRVDPDHDQAERGVPAIPRLDIGQGTNPVDAGVLPDID
jgi:hypothetical protein